MMAEDEEWGLAPISLDLLLSPLQAHQVLRL